MYKKVDFFNLSIKKEYNLKIIIMIVYVETSSLHCFIYLLTTFLTLVFCQNFIIINVIRYSCQNPFAATRPSLKEYGVIASFGLCVGLTLNATGGQVHVIVFQQTKFRAQRFTTRT